MVFWKSFKKDQEALNRRQEKEAEETAQKEGEIVARFLELIDKSP